MNIFVNVLKITKNVNEIKCEVFKTMLNRNFTKRKNVVFFLKGLKIIPYVRIIKNLNENQICQANDNM